MCLIIILSGYIRLLVNSIITRTKVAKFSGVTMVGVRVVSSEISGNFPRKISGNLFQSFRKFPEIFKNNFYFIIFNYNQIKKSKISMF